MNDQHREQAIYTIDFDSTWQKYRYTLGSLEAACVNREYSPTYIKEHAINPSLGLAGLPRPVGLNPDLETRIIELKFVSEQHFAMMSFSLLDSNVTPRLQ